MSEKNSYKGTVSGGPLDREKITNNSPKGFLLVDEDFTMAWKYDYDENNGTFTVKNEDALEVTDKMLRAYEEDSAVSIVIFTNSVPETDDEVENG